MYHDLWRKTADNQTNIHRPISQKDSIGIALPVRENEEDSYFVGEYDIINASGRKAKGKKIIYTVPYRAHHMAQPVYKKVWDETVNKPKEEFLKNYLK